ncbi:hypothetical protein Tco_1310276 [Tanacetum coccineum]
MVIREEINSTVEACNTLNEIGQPLKDYNMVIMTFKPSTNLFWNNLQVTTMQMNVQYLQHFNQMVKFQKEFNDIRADEWPKGANPLALLRLLNPCKEVANQLHLNPESVSKKTEILNKLRVTRKCKKNLALLAKYFKKLYKLPTTTSNFIQLQEQTEDTTPSSSHLLQQTGIQCFLLQGIWALCKVFSASLKGYWLEDTDEEIDEQEYEAHYSYMAKTGVSPKNQFYLSAIRTVQKPYESNVFANERRHSGQPESINDTYVLEKDNNVTPDSSNICNNDNQVDQNAADCVDECAALANLIANY